MSFWSRAGEMLRLYRKVWSLYRLALVEAEARPSSSSMSRATGAAPPSSAARDRAERPSRETIKTAAD